MDKMKTNTSGTTHNAGFPPAPSKARQQASYEGQIRTITLNEPWARRQLALCVRSEESLSSVARLLVDHLSQQPAPSA